MDAVAIAETDVVLELKYVSPLFHLNPNSIQLWTGTAFVTWRNPIVARKAESLLRLKSAQQCQR